ncbi:15786_t:CDS:2, partial [Racocetra persica]
SENITDGRPFFQLGAIKEDSERGLVVATQNRKGFSLNNPYLGVEYPSIIHSLGSVSEKIKKFLEQEQHEEIPNDIRRPKNEKRPLLVIGLKELKKRKNNGSTVNQERRSPHPGIIISNNQQNLYSPLITIIPLTSQLDKIYPFEVLTEINNQKGKALTNQITTIDKKRLGDYLRQLDKSVMRKIQASLHLTLALEE